MNPERKIKHYQSWYYVNPRRNVDSEQIWIPERIWTHDPKWSSRMLYHWATEDSVVNKGQIVGIDLNEEIIKVREWIPHIGPLAKVIRLELFLDIVPSSFRGYYSHVAWMFSWRKNDLIFNLRISREVEFIQFVSVYSVRTPKQNK